MHEPARTVSEAVTTRRSMRAFSDKPVDGALVRRLLDVARWSPSGGNLQPWHVTVLSGGPLEELKRIMRVKPDGFVNSPEGAGYEIYPPDLPEPYKTRRSRCGEMMYATMNIARTDKAARLGFVAGNFVFWNAPVGMFFSLGRRMGPPQWSDLGMYIQTLMLLAREAGLHTCPQESWTNWHRTIGAYLALPADRILFCGLALGYADESAPVNTLRTERAPLQEFADFPIQRLAERFDMIVIDHPFAGYAARHPTLLPFDELLPDDFLADQAAHSVGASYRSYEYGGHLWALPIDAATPFSSFDISAVTAPR